MSIENYQKKIHSLNTINNQIFILRNELLLLRNYLIKEDTFIVKKICMYELSAEWSKLMNDCVWKDNRQVSSISQ